MAFFRGILLVVITLFYSCNLSTKNADLRKIVSYWDNSVSQAVLTCSDTLAVLKARTVIRFVNELNLRDSVVSHMKDLINESEVIYLIECNAGDPPSYQVLAKSEKPTIYVFEFDSKLNKIIGKIVYNESSDYSILSKSFNEWDDYVESTTNEKRVFSCDELYLRKETYFNLTFNIQDFK